MRFVADLHIHSKYSRACSRDCDLEHLAWWAGRKGIAVVGTGDLCHPAWAEAIRAKLAPAEPGLFRLRSDLERDVQRRLPAACRTPVRFLLSVEISTIYKRADRTRKVHHLLYVPDLAAADDLTRRLARVGNLASDGRPILGLDSRDLLDITLSTSDSSYLVPAHLWTPWFAVLGSKSGFDSVADCYADLADHVFAVETGLSSDPAMNWRVSALDSYRLVSNSDAHSPPMLGREATLFDTDVDYWAILAALRTGEGFAGTVEFFPEEGKYHADGHRRCEVRLDPAETRARGGRCPACGAALTVGVLHRVEVLADRPHGARPAGAAPFHSLVQLPQIVGEIRGVGPKSQSVQADVADLVDKLGPELAILTEVPLDAIEREGSAVLAEAIRRLRRGEVIREGGYDGEYGVIRLFDPKELADFAATPALFDVPASRARSSPPERTVPEVAAESAAMAAVSASRPDIGVDPEQRAAVDVLDGPLLVVAGPGTGKTRTLTHRIARLVTDRGVPPEQCLAITFTRRASEEMRERLAALLPGQAERVLVTTFHGLGLRILRENADRCGLAADFRVADETERLALLREACGRTGPPVDARRLLAEASRLSRALAAGPLAAADGRRMPAGTAGPSLAATAPAAPGEADPVDAAAGVAGDGVDAEWVGPLARYRAAKRARSLVDLDDLLALPVGLLAADRALARTYQARWPWPSVDEYQDVDATQYRLLRLLCPPDGNLCAIGDPDQAIYRFRGADVGFFLRFRADFPGARVVELTRNYRSSAAILRAALGAVAPATLVPGRVLVPSAAPPDAPERLVLHSAADERTEAAYVVSAIDRLLGGSSFHSLDTGRVEPGPAAAHSFADFAILYRTDAQSLALVDALEAAGLPYQKRSHHRLAEQPGVREVLAALRTARTAGGSPRPVAALLRAAAQSAIDAAGGLPALAGAAAPRGDGAEPALRIGQIRAAVELLSPLAERADADLDRFLGEIALGAEVDLWDPRADRVSLLTLHAAKGLEFPVVFIVGCDDGLLPFRWADLEGRDDAGGEIDEERRLFFVGLTRARTHLVLTHARRRAWRGAGRDMAPSRFLAGIDGSLLERTSGAARPRTVQLRLL
jgi:DNA helicase II / ATP-dependent DNA helicase PcrA